MIYVGIDVAKDEHECYITNSDGEVLFTFFTIMNNRDGFNELHSKIQSVADDLSKVKVGLEATGHYGYNILGYLLDKGLTTYVINPLHTNLYRKSMSLRKAKTDKIDSRTIVMMLMSDVNVKPYSDTSYHNEELKSLTRYRFDKVKERAKLKVSISRLVTILFPELEKLVPSLHLGSVYTLLSKYPGASHISTAHLTTLTNLLSEASKGRYGKEMATIIRGSARLSIGMVMDAKSLELRHTIKLIHELDSDIKEVESMIKSIMDSIKSPILSIPGISYRMGAMIIAEVGDFKRFNSPDKILAYAGLSPSVYQSGQYEASHSRMEKRGSRYLRYALFNAAKFVCLWDPTFATYLAKKRSEGKHYNVAISHACKKLVRVIYKMEQTQQLYIKA
jgi:transposase